MKFEEVKCYLNYYANRFCKRYTGRFEHDELVNEAWIAIQGQEIPQFWSQGIRWAMQTYIDRQLRQDRRGKVGVKITSMDKINGEENLHDVVAAKKNHHEQKVENEQNIKESQIFIKQILSNPHLNKKEKKLTRQLFVENMTQGEIAIKEGITRTAICMRKKALCKKLKRLNHAA